jgi:cell division protein FtsL
MAKKSKNSDLNKIAKNVISNMRLDKNKDYGVDPITIIIVIGVILSLIRVIQECRKNRKLIKDRTQLVKTMQLDIQDIILRDSFINRLRLKKIIKQNISKEQYKAYGSQLQTSIMETGVNLTEDEIYTLMEASQNV